MNHDRIIVGIDFTICRLMAALNTIFFTVPGWKARHDGFNVKFAKDTVRPTVFIHPIGWPSTSYVGAQLELLKFGWQVVKGTVYASHLVHNGVELHGLEFNVTSDVVSGHIKIISSNSTSAADVTFKELIDKAFIWQST